MGQQRLNHLMILNIHKERCDNLDLVYIANEFVQGRETRQKRVHSKKLNIHVHGGLAPLLGAPPSTGIY